MPKKRPSHHQQAGAVTATPLAHLLIVTRGRGGRGTRGGESCGGRGEASEGEARRALRREQHSGEVEKEM